MTMGYWLMYMMLQRLTIDTSNVYYIYPELQISCVFAFFTQ